MKTSRFLVLVAALVVIAAAAFPLAAQQPPIKIGEINSFSGIGAPFTGPYRSAVEMAVEEINAKGGVLGRKVEVLFRDDKGQTSCRGIADDSRSRPGVQRPFVKLAVYIGAEHQILPPGIQTRHRCRRDVAGGTSRRQ